MGLLQLATDRFASLLSHQWRAHWDASRLPSGSQHERRGPLLTPENRAADRVALWLSGFSCLYRRLLDGADSVTDWVS